MQTIINSPITFTSNAITEIKRLINEPDFVQGQYLRVGVKGGGCSGLSYVLGFDNKEANDEVYDMEGVEIIIKQAHGMYLMGMEIDYPDGLNARGFTFKNPNASSTCGCGSSFAV